MPPIRTMMLGALAVGAQAFSSTPTTTTGGLPPCGTIDDNGLNCQGLKKSDGNCWKTGDTWASYGSMYYPDNCDCTTFCCSDDNVSDDHDDAFENGECDTTRVGR